MQVYELITCVQRVNENAGNVISVVQFLINIYYILLTKYAAIKMQGTAPLKKGQKVGIIHHSRQVGFQIAMQIIHALCWGANTRKKANCGKSARRNIET